MKKVILCLSLFFIAVHKIIAQNHFSQFYSSPLQYNPAQTGRFDDKFRIGASFRNEKNTSSIYSQSLLFFDTRILNSVVPINDCFAIGAWGMHEQGLSDGIKNNYLSFSLGYQKSLNSSGTHQLGIGFQTVLGNKRIDPPSFVYEDQIRNWIQAGFRNINPFQPPIINITYFDLNVGLIYQGSFNENSFFSFGASRYHVTSPTKSYQGVEFSLTPESWFDLSWEKKLSFNRKIYSAVILNIQKKSINDAFLGLFYQMNIIRTSSQIQFGGWFRNNKFKGTSLIPLFGVKFATFTINISYDINISNKTTSQQGSSEISLIYTKGFNRLKSNDEKKFIQF